MNLEEVEQRDQAETVPCPQKPHGCGMPAGTTCRNIHTGVPLERFPAHLVRLKAAGVQLTPTTAAERAGRPAERTPR